MGADAAIVVVCARGIVEDADALVGRFDSRWSAHLERRVGSLAACNHALEEKQEQSNGTSVGERTSAHLVRLDRRLECESRVSR